MPNPIPEEALKSHAFYLGDDSIPSQAKTHFKVELGLLRQHGTKSYEVCVCVDGIVCQDVETAVKVFEDLLIQSLPKWNDIAKETNKIKKY